MIDILGIEKLTIFSVTFIVFASALYTDLRCHRIANSLCLVALLSGLIIQSYFGQWQGLLDALLGAGLAFLLLLPVYYFRILGAGDVKLMMAVGALSGPMLLGWSLAYGIMFGGITSLLIAAYHVGWSGIKNTLVRYYQCLYIRHYFKPETGEAAALRVPYAPALVLGWLCACYFNSELKPVFVYLFISPLGG